MIKEPTSSLDSHLALDLISNLRLIAFATKKIIISSIHQPSSKIFFNFTKLLLLAQGKVLYNGPVEKVADFLTSLDWSCPQNTNIADHLIDLARSDDASLPLLSAEYMSRNPVNVASSHILDHEKYRPRSIYFKHKVPLFNQFIALTKIQVKQFLRVKWTIQYFLQFSLLGIIFGLVFFQMEINTNRVENYLGLLSYMSVQSAMDPFYTSLNSFNADLAIIRKERFGGTYKFCAYYVSKVITDGIMLMLRPTIAFTISYWMIGLSYSWWFVIYMIIIYFVAVLSQAVGLFISSFGLEPTKQLSLGTLVTVSFVLLCGFYNKDIPVFVQPIRYLSPVYYGYILLLWTQLLAEDGLQCGPQPNSTNHINPAINCPPNVEKLPPQDVMSLTMSEFHPGYNILLMIGLIIIFHLLTFFNLRRVILQRLNQKSFGSKIIHRMKKIFCCK